ncbi:MAG: COG3650 family protein [Gemmatirosa sp.]
MPPDWDAARRAGVDFRAVGQEPGWLLDVDEGRSLRYVGDYGETRLTTPAPPPEVAPDGTRTWRARTGPRELVVVARPVPCRDGMSGAPFTHTVTVQVDGRELQGCGQAPALGAPVVP